MLILASTSPRRIELLESAGLSFKIQSPNFEESSIDATLYKIEDYVQLLAQKKAESIEANLKEDVIIAADTIVVIENKILGKPINEEDAFKMLKKLSNKKHYVLTGVCIIKNEKTETFYSQSEVSFNELSEEDILNYIATKEPMDKAGAYAIQGIGSKFVKSYKGDFHTIIGLPLKEVLKRI